MLKPIIPIDRAPESWINALIDAGILIVTEDGIKCAEPQESVHVAIEHAATQG